MPVTSLLHVPSTCTVVTEAMEHREELHVKAVNSLTQQATLQLLATHSSAPHMAHGSESAMLGSPVKHVPPAHTIIKDLEQRDHAVWHGAEGDQRVLGQDVLEAVPDEPAPWHLALNKSVSSSGQRNPANIPA